MSQPKKPQDHLAPLKTEAQAVPTVAVTFEGHEFIVHADPLDWSGSALRAVEDGKAINAVREILGADAYDKAKLDSWPVRKITGLFEAIAQAAGLEDAGN